jgi:hypothetical protein
MRKDLRIIASLTFLTALLLTAGLGKIENKVSQIRNYPATVCPGSKSDGSLVDILPNSKVLGTSIPSNKNKMTKVGVSNFATKKALLVDGGSVTSTSVLRGSSGWLGVVSCSISDGDDWFIGGSANVSSKGVLSIVNSGLSAAQVDLKIYSSKAPITVSKPIPANSSTYVMIDSLAPGEDSIAINAITRAGRVSIFALDNRSRGLRSIGGDYIATSPSPSKTIVIPNIPVPKGKSNQILRVVVPGNVDANLKAAIYSSDGSFAPSGVDGVTINGDTVKDIEFKPIVADSTYSLRIDADVPISASVLSTVSGDLVWSTSAPEITDTSIQLGGFTPLIRIYGKNIDVNLSWIDKNGKRGGKHLVGTDTLAFRPKLGLLRAQFTANIGDNFGSLLVNSGGGYSVLPIASGSHLESSTLPRSDARAINRG